MIASESCEVGNPGTLGMTKRRGWLLREDRCQGTGRLLRVGRRISNRPLFSDRPLLATVLSFVFQEFEGAASRPLNASLQITLHTVGAGIVWVNNAVGGATVCPHCDEHVFPGRQSLDFIAELLR